MRLVTSVGNLFSLNCIRLRIIFRFQILMRFFSERLLVCSFSKFVEACWLKIGLFDCCEASICIAVVLTLCLSLFRSQNFISITLSNQYNILRSIRQLEQLCLSALLKRMCFHARFWAFVDCYDFFRPEETWKNSWRVNKHKCCLSRSSSTTRSWNWVALTKPNIVSLEVQSLKKEFRWRCRLDSTRMHCRAMTLLQCPR